MLNLLGDVWLDPNIEANQIVLTSYPEAKFHWYGKSAAKSGRKMGHISLTDSDPLKLIDKIKQLKSELNLSLE